MTLASLDTKDVGEILSSIRQQMSDPNMGEVTMDEQQTQQSGEDVLVLTEMVEDENPTQGVETFDNSSNTSQTGDSFAQSVLSPEELQAIQSAPDGDFNPFDEIGKVKSSPVELKAQETPAVSDHPDLSTEDFGDTDFDTSSALQEETFTTDATSFEASAFENNTTFKEQQTATEEIFSMGAGVKSMVSDAVKNVFNNTGGDEPLVSPETAKESLQAFSELAGALHTIRQHTAKQETFSMDKAGNYTLENLMRELLKPMLKEWLDANLPSIVKWLVTEQIEKMLQAQGLGNIAGTAASAGAGASQNADTLAPSDEDTNTTPAKTDEDAA